MTDDWDSLMEGLWNRTRGIEVAPPPPKAVPRAVKAAPPRQEPPQEEAHSTWHVAAVTLGPITWHWERWLAPGFLHILAARTGLGKSTLALRIAGCYLAGWPWPDGRPFEGEKGAVLWLEAEGAQALNVDRAGKWGLPLDAIHTPLADALEDFNLLSARHRHAAEKWAADPAVRLVVLDSLSGARAGADENDSRALQSMKWLAELARNTGKPVLATHHLRKRSILDGTDEVNLERLRGSSAIVQVARVVWGLDVPNPAQPSRLRLQVLKDNLGRFPPPLGMRIEEDGRVTFGEAPEPPQSETATERAARFLRRILANGPMKASEILAAAEREGISEKVLRVAKDKLCIESHQQVGGWWWTLDVETPGADSQIPE